MFDDCKICVSKNQKNILSVTKKNQNFYNGFKLIKTEGCSIFSPNRNCNLENKFEIDTLNNFNKIT